MCGVLRLGGGGWSPVDPSCVWPSLAVVMRAYSHPRVVCEPAQVFMVCRRCVAIALKRLGLRACTVLIVPDTASNGIRHTALLPRVICVAELSRRVSRHVSLHPLAPPGAAMEVDDTGPPSCLAPLHLWAIAPGSCDRGQRRHSANTSSARMATCMCIRMAKLR